MSSEKFIIEFCYIYIHIDGFLLVIQLLHYHSAYDVAGM